jgi:hypothetical protein
MLNRLMSIYFIQRQGFLDTKSKHALDGDREYLRNRLKMSQEHNGSNTFHSFYRYFLLRLFREGLNARERTPELERLLRFATLLKTTFICVLPQKRYSNASSRGLKISQGQSKTSVRSRPPMRLNSITPPQQSTNERSVTN